MKKHIYIMLSHTNTAFGKIIRFFSHFTYNHVSISMSPSLQPLYSFARYHYNSALVGGFVEESLLRYLYHGQNTQVRIYRIEINDEQFKKLQSIIESYSKDSQKYIYDTFGVFRGDTYISQYQRTCLSFTVSILRELQILSSNIKIKTIQELAECLSAFPHTDTVLTNEIGMPHVWGNDKYYEKVPFGKIVSDTLLHFQKLLL